MNARLKSDGERLLETVFTLALCCWLGALGIMLAAGVLHAHVSSAISPIGYWTAFGLYWCLGLSRMGWAAASEWRRVK